jgi:hypothetical protein
MKKFSVWVKILAVTLLIAVGSLVWAWLSNSMVPSSMSRGFLVGGLLSVLFGIGIFATSHSFAAERTSGYSDAFYNTLKQRSNLMMADMAEHSSISMVLLGSGVLSVIIGFLIFRFG